MRYFIRCGAVLIVLVAILGIGVCVLSVARLWTVRSHANVTIRHVAGRIDQTLEVVQRHAAMAERRVLGIREAADSLNERVQLRIATARDMSPEDAPDIDELERQLRARIQLGSDWIGLVQDSVDLVAQLVDMAESTSLFFQQESRAGEDLLAAVREGKRELSKTLDLVDAVQGRMAAIRAHRDVEENARQIKTLSSRIHASLVKTQGHAANFQEVIGRTRTRIEDLVATIRYRMIVGAVTATAILIWFSVAQVSLALHGWKYARRT